MFKHFCHQHCCAFRVVTHPMWPFWFKSGWSRQCLKEIDFGYSTTVLGKEGAIDFLDSSPWPFSIIDAFLNINETQLLGPVSQQMMEMLMEMLMMITNSDMSHLRFSLKPHPNSQNWLLGLPAMIPMKKSTSDTTPGVSCVLVLATNGILRRYQPPSTSYTCGGGGVTCHLVLGAGGYVATLPYRCHLGLTFFWVVCMG